MFLKTFYSVCIFSLTVMWNICTVKPCTISITSLLFPTPQTLKSLTCFLCETADYKKKKPCFTALIIQFPLKRNLFNGKQFLFVVPFNLTGSLKCFKSSAVGWGFSAVKVFYFFSNIFDLCVYFDFDRSCFWIVHSCKPSVSLSS